MEKTITVKPKDKVNEWDNEANYMQGIYFGLPCFIHRHEYLKTLNGYVGVPNNNRWFGKDYNDIECEVHGDLTFSGGGTHDIFGYYWWLGFDCNHCYDFCPGMESVTNNNSFAFKNYNDIMNIETTYKNMLFVQEQCISLAYQLCDLKLSVDHTPFSSERKLIGVKYEKG